MTIDSLRDVWQTDPDPVIAQQAHELMASQIHAPRWSITHTAIATGVGTIATYALF